MESPAAAGGRDGAAATRRAAERFAHFFADCALDLGCADRDHLLDQTFSWLNLVRQRAARRRLEAQRDLIHAHYGEPKHMLKLLHALLDERTVLEKLRDIADRQAAERDSTASG